MPNTPVEQFTAAAKSGAETLTAGGTAAMAGFQELAKAYQDLATQNAEKLTASIQALSAVKTPAEFIALQQKLLKEGVNSAVGASRKIAELTATVFTTAFEPIKKQVEAVQKSMMK